MKSNDEKLKAFGPVFGNEPEILILGSMPGEESLRKQQYYAHPKNAFWPIMEKLLCFPHGTDYARRLEKLKTHKIALWDVLESCVRPGSMDSDIKEAKLNDFKNFFRENQSVRKIIFNGATAERLFIKSGTAAFAPEKCGFEKAPSTSPAYASMSFEKKLKAWAELLFKEH